MIHRIARLAPLAVLAVATSACFATRNDLVVLQNDIIATRSELLAADSARAAQLERVLSRLGGAQDTLTSINQRFTRFQGDVRTDMNSFSEQLVRVQELLGVSQAELRRLRADMEQRAREPVVTPPPGTTPGQTSSATPPAGETPAAGAPPAGTPGPAQLYQLGTASLQRGSPGTGRAQLEDLVRYYPNDRLVPDAMYHIADAYNTEEEFEAADSVFVELIERFPRAERTPEALYRHGVIMQNGGRNREARAAYDRLIKDFPRSDAAKLARDRLQTLP